jgi:hypothetical protein
MVGVSDLSFFLILQFSEFGLCVILFVLFLYSLTVLNTLSTDNDIIPCTSLVGELII